MPDHNLEDLIINENAPKDNNKSKGLLTILALLIAILVIAIMMTNMVLNEDENDSPKQPEQIHEVSPDLQPVEKTKEDNEEFDELSAMLKKEVKEKTEDTKEVDEVKPETAQIDEEKDTDTKVAPASTSFEDNTEETVKEVIPTKQVEKSKPKEIKPKKEKKKKDTQKANISRGSYYIQVGSFTSKPSSRFLQIIKNNGFPYKLHSSGKLLIGSYASRDIASRDLPRVKDRINKGAFIIKIK